MGKENTTGLNVTQYTQNNIVNTTINQQNIGAGAVADGIVINELAIALRALSEQLSVKDEQIRRMGEIMKLQSEKISRLTKEIGQNKKLIDYGE